MPDRKTRTEVIIFRGIVQGVGFRPTVYRIAQKLGMKGCVRNMGGAVQLICTGAPEEIDAFIREIVSRKPPMSRISGVERKKINTAVFHDFTIATSSAEEDEISIIPADIAICDDCLLEFYDPENPRYQHPFISCTNCGPRVSIIERLPYDRDTTTMTDFSLCDFCGKEYADPASRRYHAQTVSCHDCGPQPLLEPESCAIAGKAKQTKEAPLSKAIDLLSAGKILAIKGVGGYCFACSPFDEEAVQKLREIKRREQKPFAVMFRDIGKIKDYCIVSPSEEIALSSPQRPILLLEQRPDAADGRTGNPPIAPGVCNTSRFVGAFLPSFGLLYLLLDALGALVMTSANLSEKPLITDDEKMAEMAMQKPGIAGVLFNKRRIVTGLDDSVARIVDGEIQLIRRAKGYVPNPVYVQTAGLLTKDAQIFAAGGHLKSVFSLSKGAYSYPSRHIGDLDSVEAENVYAETFKRMKAFFEIEPLLAVCDLHPNYFPTRFAKGLGLPLIYAQHHHAHIASVMAEHGIGGPVIGVSFDGTGFGTDGAIWGGEILICENASCERFSHLKYFDMIGGDSSMKDAWKTAISYIHDAEKGVTTIEKETIAEGFSVDMTPLLTYCRAKETLGFLHNNNEHETVLAALGAEVNTVKTSSMGRLFDAACAMLGIHYENRYEGECAILLENAAQRALTKQKFRDRPTEQETLALYFHTEVAQKILMQCRLAREKTGARKVCLSGGVFQNKILMEEALRLLRGDGFSVYYNIHVPPNDGGLALGQNYIGMLSR